MTGLINEMTTQKSFHLLFFEHLRMLFDISAEIICILFPFFKGKYLFTAAMSLQCGSGTVNWESGEDFSSSSGRTAATRLEEKMVGI